MVVWDYRFMSFPWIFVSTVGGGSFHMILK